MDVPITSDLTGYVSFWAPRIRLLLCLLSLLVLGVLGIAVELWLLWKTT
jgi:hypothetical protein